MNNPAPSTPPRTSEREIAATRTLLRYFLLLLIGTLVASNFPLPWKVAGLLFALGAVTVGLIALVGLVKQKAPVLLRISTTIGLVASLFLMLGLGAAVLLWPVTSEFEDCMSTALTTQAQQDCEDGLRNLSGWLDQ